MAFSEVVEGSIYLSILMEWGERDVLFHKTIFIFGPCGAKNKNFEPAFAGSGPDGPEKIFCKQKIF